jgi:hypothetical protein
MTQRMLVAWTSLLMMTRTVGHAQTRGEFSSSCSNIALDPKTAVLSANCKRGDGSLHSGASLNLNGFIANDNGNLKYVGASGDFSRSCGNINLNPKTEILSANCKKGDGSTHSGASIDLNDAIANDHGNLRYVGSGGAAPPPAQRPAGSQTVKIPQHDGSLSGLLGNGDPVLGIITGDSMPYHVRGEVEYLRSGSDVHITAVHIFGWATAKGNAPFACGNFGVNAKHLSINGRDYSGSLVWESGMEPSGWVVSSWVAKFLGPEYPTFHSGGAVSVRADAAFDGASCIVAPPFSIASSVTL